MTDLNSPVLERLMMTLDLAKCQSSAIVDNAMVEGQIPADVYRSLMQDLHRVHANLDQALTVQIDKEDN